MSGRRFTTVVTLGFALASCGSSNTTPIGGDGEPSTAQSPPMAEMSPSAAGETRRGKGTGKITAIDSAAGKITLDHGPIPELGWPAMTMAFKAAPSLTKATTVGDEVEFDVRVNGSEGEIVAIAKN